MTTAAPVELAGDDRLASWRPSGPMISAKLLELRRRKGLMATMLVLIVGVPLLVIVIRSIYHAANPSTSGPTGSPSFFSAIVDVMATFSFIAAATLGAAAGTTDLGDGVFRQLVITGRSRLALFLARIPAGLAIVVPLLGATFAVLCLVTAFAGTPTPSAVNVSGVSVPAYLSQGQFSTWLDAHPGDAGLLVGGPGVGTQPSVHDPRFVEAAYTNYMANEVQEFTPPVNEMVKIGLWLELVAGVGYVIGLGLGVLTGQRTVATIIVIILQIVLTPIAVMAQIPDFVNGQRLIVGVPLTQLRPVFLRSQNGGQHNNGAPAFGGHGALSIPAMPTWAMLAVIAGWLVLWSGLGARKMLRRDA